MGLHGRYAEFTCNFHVEQLIDSQDPVFAGHYPHFAIYPGALLVDRMWRAVLHHAAMSGVKLALTKVQRVNFHHPVFPGTKISLKCTCEYPLKVPLCVRLEVMTDRSIATARMEFGVVHAD